MGNEGTVTAKKKPVSYPRWRWVHGTLALFASLPLIIQGVTGMLLSYEKETVAAFGDKRESMETRLTPAELHSRAIAQLPTGNLRWAIWFGDPQQPVWVRWQNETGEEASYLLQPGSGNLMEASTRWHRRFEIVLSIHRTLAMERPGQIIMGTSAAILVGLLLTGMIIQIQRSQTWRRLIGLRRLRTEKKHPGFWKWSHAVAGFWLSPILLIIATTGMLWSFDTWRSIIEWVTQSEAKYAATPTFELSGQETVNLENIFQASEPYLAAATAMRVIVPRDASTPARFEWAPSNAPYENFRSKIWIHPASGEILDSYLLEDYTTAETVIRWAYPIHIGKWGGGITQFLHFIAAASVPFFALSGGYLYLKRRSGRALKTSV